MRKSQSTVILTIIIMAVILAIGSFLAISFLRGRPTAPASAGGTGQVMVEDIPITLDTNPAKEVRLVNVPAAPAQIQPENPTAVPPPDQPAQEPPTPLPPPPTLPPPPPTAVPNPIIFIDYVVQPGDYLYSVAQRIDTSIALMAQEGIAQDHLIPGNVIRLPIGNPAYCPGRRPYAVGEGDTVYSIGRRFNVSVDELQRINNLDQNYTIKAAGIICIP